MVIDSTILDSVGRHLFLGFEGTCFSKELRYRLRLFRPGGLVLFRRNIQDRMQLQTLIAETSAWAEENLRRHLLWAVDEEGGPVQRLRSVYGELPAAHDAAASGPESVRGAARETARRLRDAGIHIDFAPVLDVVQDSRTHFLGKRAFGSDPEKVAEYGSLWITTFQKTGLAATAKHFPGLGTAVLDPHHHLPVVETPSPTFPERHLLPFRRAVDCGVRAVMTSHAVYPFWDTAWPGTLSETINREILRERLGFRGVLFSDDLDMKAILGRFDPETIVRRCLLATVDGFLVCQKMESPEPLLRAFHDSVRRHGDLRAAHERSLRRLDRLTASLVLTSSAA